MRQLEIINPRVLFFHFTTVIFFAVFLMHPFFLLPSLVISLLTSLLLNGKRVLRTLPGFIPVLLLIVLVNPLFNPGGNTVLFRLGGRPFTLEALLYGVLLALLFWTMINWFSCCNAVIDSEKYNYIFGRFLPSGSLLLSMSMRLIPLYQKRLLELIRCRESVGRGVKKGNSPFKNGAQILSATLTSALDGSVITAHSMKSRGFGLEERTAFAVYRFALRDFLYLSLTLTLTVTVLWGVVSGAATVEILPEIKIAAGNKKVIVTAVSYALLLLLPTIRIIWGEIKWHNLRSKI